MNGRRLFMLSLAAVPLAGPARKARGAAYPAVVPGRSLRFPADEGSHPEFRIEWWYATGWLSDETNRQSGFQITFFRNRAVDTGGNPSRFAPEQLIVAHAAVSDPQRGHLLHEQQIARSGFGLAEVAPGMTDARIGNWSLRAGGATLRAAVAGPRFAFELIMRRTQPPLLHGEQGFSRKGAGAESASYYYTLPHLAVEGSVAAGGVTSRVTGTAWLDHEWSSAPMESQATGWDWIGINLDDGGALMAFRMRSRTRANLWSGATLRTADGRTQTFSPQQVVWIALRQWRSPRTDATYPVGWRIKIGDFAIELDALMDDQEQDARGSTGTVYWEGAVIAREGNQRHRARVSGTHRILARVSALTFIAQPQAITIP